MIRRFLVLCYLAMFAWNEAGGTATGTIDFVQSGCCGILSGFDSTVGFRLPEGAGNLNVVVIGWNDSTTTLAPAAVTDDLGNIYAAAGRAVAGNGLTQAIYYSANVAGGWNHVHVHWNGVPSLPSVRILEYTGVAVTDPIDGGGIGAAGTGPTLPSFSLSTTSAKDLIVVGTIAGGVASPGTPGPGWFQRIYGDDIYVEDKIASKTGPHPIPQPFSGTAWITNAVAFKASAAAGSFELTIAGTGSGTGTVSGGGLDCEYALGGSSSTCAIDVAVDGTITLVATPGAQSSFGGFNGGGCSAGPVCVVSALSANTVVTADFFLDTDCTGPFTQTHPPCSTTVLYPPARSVANKRLPADKMNHLLVPANYGLPVPSCPYGGSGSDCIAQNTIAWGGRVDTGVSSGQLTIDSPARDGSPGEQDLQVPLYFTGDADPNNGQHDPVYEFCNSGEDPNVCIIVHMPSNAYWTGFGRNFSPPACGDEFIGGWDQDYGIVFSAFSCRTASASLGIGACPSASHQGTATDPCPVPGISYLSSEQVGVDQDFNWANVNVVRQATIAGRAVQFGGAGDNLSFFAELAPKVRFEELETNILHSLEGGIACTNSVVPAIFPGDAAAGATTAQCGHRNYICSTCVPNSVAPGGALLFLDYTDSQIAAMNLDVVTNSIITALAHYGTYLSVYGNCNPGAPPNCYFGAQPIAEGMESGQGYFTQVGGQHPFFVGGGSWPGYNGQHLGSPSASVPQKTVSCGDHAPPTSQYRCAATDDEGNALGPLYGIPLVGGTNILSHVHILDPCAVAGMTGPIDWAGGAVPSACTGEIIVQLGGSAAGTVTSTPSGINCDHAPYCDMGYALGQAVTLTAVPLAGHQFTGWAGSGCSGTGDCTITTGATPQQVVATYN